MGECLIRGETGRQERVFDRRPESSRMGDQLEATIGQQSLLFNLEIQVVPDQSRDNRTARTTQACTFWGNSNTNFTVDVVNYLLMKARIRWSGLNAISIIQL